MALPNTPKPQFPSVPNAAGVPPIPRQTGQVEVGIVALSNDVQGVLNMFSAPQWGLFTDGGFPAFGGLGQFGGAIGNFVQSALNDLGLGGLSVGEVEFMADHRVATAPLEQGSFLSYNKVALPFQGRVKYYVSGSLAQRTAFLQQLALYQNSTMLLTLIVPEIAFANVNVVHHSWRRTAKNGVTMFEAEIWLEEIRLTGTAEFSNTQQPSGADPVNNGTSQPQTPTPAQQQTIEQQGVG